MPNYELAVFIAKKCNFFCKFCIFPRNLIFLVYLHIFKTKFQHSEMKNIQRKNMEHGGKEQGT